MTKIRLDWAERFSTQSEQCGILGSDLYRRLLEVISDDIACAGPSWELIRPFAGLRYGQAGPLRLVASAHHLGLSGMSPRWAMHMPSCGGTAPDVDEELRSNWLDLVEEHPEDLQDGLDREVQTNEVARSVGLALALAATGFDDANLIEIGCSGGLNLRLDKYRIDLGNVVLGHENSPVRLHPEMRSPVRGDLKLPNIIGRTGIDLHPIDVATDHGQSRLLSFLWPDQLDRIERTRVVIAVSRAVPALLVSTDDTVGAVAGSLAAQGPRVVMHSIVWQYIPTSVRWGLTELIETVGRQATSDSPLAWIRYEPDEWNRSRAAVWLRTWPDGGDRLVAHVDFHGRWLDPLI